MSVSGCSSCSAALGVLTSSTGGQLQQKIAAKIVVDQMEDEAAVVMKIVQSDNELAASSRTGSRVDIRA